MNLAAAVPFVLPVLGGMLGVIYVNLNPMAQLNPFIAVAAGVFLGWLVARGIAWVIDRRHGG